MQHPHRGKRLTDQVDALLEREHRRQGLRIAERRFAAGDAPYEAVTHARRAFAYAETAADPTARYRPIPVSRLTPSTLPERRPCDVSRSRPRGAGRPRARRTATARTAASGDDGPPGPPPSDPEGRP
jgi:hypothetical protein